MLKKPFHEIWAELEDSGFFSVKFTTVLPSEPTGEFLDEMCREFADENCSFSHCLSYFERNLNISVHEKDGATEFCVYSSRPHYSKGFGYGKSSDAFYGNGETFEDAIRMLYKNFISKPNAVKCKPIHTKLENGVTKLVRE
ncbi:hypothetical protein [Photobacterium damselae]|uniref:hypothetical protein n=1 Tax=Photobacterium damselae TaxID=38293 RepID=UPI001F367813|nr:hypothetical protein [Photobacterium damselae]UKA04678.1 hypothetical protein IHC89_23960 [Photobacterium damselae subsp. damselae]